MQSAAAGEGSGYLAEPARRQAVMNLTLEHQFPAHNHCMALRATGVMQASCSYIVSSLARINPSRVTLLIILRRHCTAHSSALV